MANDLIRYDLLVQDALRGVVRDVLGQAAKNGLQGDHHFFITFRTTAPGLRLSNRMRTRYPEEMTIILQHQFWDLGVTDHAFEVGLSFSNIPERLLVPFAAIVSFVDPSVQFGLKFDAQDEGATTTTGELPPAPASNAPEPLKALPGKRTLAAVENDDGVVSALPAKGDAAVKQTVGRTKPTLAKSTAKEGDAPPAPAGRPTAEKDEPKAEEAADPKKVVSIDAFRKKP